MTHSSVALAGQAMREEIIEILRRQPNSSADTLATDILRVVTDRIGASAFAATDAERVWLELEKRCASVHDRKSDDLTLLVRWGDLWDVMQPNGSTKESAP